MPFKLGKQSKINLVGVSPRMVAVVELALTICPVDFKVIEGLRKYIRQVELFKAKKSKTMKSKHLKQKDGYSHAVDIIPCTLDPWNDKDGFEHIRRAMFGAAKQLGVSIRYGADWDRDGKTAAEGDKDEKFVDKPHWELY